MTIQVFGRFQVKPDYRDRYKAAQMAVRQGSVHEKGCLGIRLFEDAQDPNVLYGYLRFVDEEAVAYHRAQPYEAALRELSDTAMVVPPEAFVLDEAISGDTYGEPTRAADPGELTVAALFDVKPCQRDVVVAQYEKQIPNVRAHDGCVSFNAWPVVGQPTQLVVLEWWTSPAVAQEFSTTDPLSVETGQVLAASLERPIPEYLNTLRELYPDDGAASDSQTTGA